MTMLGCGSHGDKPQQPPEPPTPPPHVWFGACTTAIDESWISGPRPQAIAIAADHPPAAPAADPDDGVPPIELDEPPALDPVRAPILTPAAVPGRRRQHPVVHARRDRGQQRARAGIPRGPWVQFADLTGVPGVRLGGTYRLRASLAAAYPAFLACFAKLGTGRDPTAGDLRVHVHYELDRELEPSLIVHAEVSGGSADLDACISGALLVPGEEVGPVGATLIFHASPPQPAPPFVAPRELFGSDDGERHADPGEHDPHAARRQDRDVSRERPPRPAAPCSSTRRSMRRRGRSRTRSFTAATCRRPRRRASRTS